MCKAHVLSPQDLRFILDLKESLGLPHRGPDGMPRKAVWSALGKSEAWYSLVLNPETLDLPNLVDLRKVCVITGNTEPLRVFSRWTEESAQGPEEQAGHLLTSTIEADHLFTGHLARALEDGRVSPKEARELVITAATRMRQAQQTFDTLKKLAGRR